MKQIIPYSTQKEALKILDNGGKFYNVFARAGDDVISKEELSKVVGLFCSKRQMILFLELAISCLSEDDQTAIISRLDNNMLSNYQLYKAQRLLASEAQVKSKLAANTIITGIPQLISSEKSFNGFIMVPIPAGKVTTFTMIPIVERYDVYELKDENSDDNFFIAHSKGKGKLPQQKVQIAGTIKELKDYRETEGPYKKFLEAIYWMQ